ncbi:hypothetical protein, partial [Endozoicomonas sp. SESOKO4]
KVCKNAESFSSHKSKYHSGQKTCDMSVLGKDGQQRACGAVCKHARALLTHKRRHRKRKPVDEDQKVDLSR